MYKLDFILNEVFLGLLFYCASNIWSLSLYIHWRTTNLKPLFFIRSAKRFISKLQTRILFLKQTNKFMRWVHHQLMRNVAQKKAWYYSLPGATGGHSLASSTYDSNVKCLILGNRPESSTNVVQIKLYLKCVGLQHLTAGNGGQHRATAGSSRQWWVAGS